MIVVDSSVWIDYFNGIGTYCIARRVPLLYSDIDFDPMVQHLGLTVP